MERLGIGRFNNKKINVIEIGSNDGSMLKNFKNFDDNMLELLQFKIICSLIIIVILFCILSFAILLLSLFVILSIV